jgi:hypothetical protein
MDKNLPIRLLSWVLYVFSSLFLGLIFFLGRSSVMTATMLLSQNAYLPRFIDKAYLVIFGLVWLIGWVYLDGYYSKGVMKHKLWPYFLRITGIELILLFISMILAMFYTTLGINWTGVGLVTLALIAGFVMIYYSKRMLLEAKSDSSNRTGYPKTTNSQ